MFSPLNSARSPWRLLPQLEIPPSLRALARARESSLVLLGAATGAAAGLVVAFMSAAVTLLHAVFFGITPGQRLSELAALSPATALSVPCLGGLAFGLALHVIQRWRPSREVDPIEANALHGGRMSLIGSLSVALQTVWSSGVGASVGLEAGYTQLASAIGSSIGRAFRLRRRDLRILVGCGAAGAIAGAFAAPLAGAFYAFELIIASYSAASLAPVGVAALVGYLVANGINPTPLGIGALYVAHIGGRDLAIASALGFAAAGTGIGVMGGVALCEAWLNRLRVPPFARAALGGLAVGALALASPQVLSLALDPHVYAIIGMSALSASVVGGPLTMTFIALETTGDLWLTTAVLIAVIVAAQVTRETFGYSFATWRFHLRGESIRSAADIGWIRDLTVRRMMRPDVRTVPAHTTISRFRMVVPLGSTTHVVALDADKDYAGIVQVAEAHAPELDEQAPVRDILRHRGAFLLPTMTVKDAVATFDKAEAEALAVVQSGDSRRVIGLLSEAHALRRYSEQLELRRQELIGE